MTSRGAIPSPRRLDILAAWYQEGCSNIGAGRRLNLSDQVIRNELHHLRREQGVKDNQALVRRYRELIMERKPRPTVRKRAA